MPFVSCEGLDGAGTTTVVEAIAEQFPDATITSEPSDLEYGQLVRRNLSDESSDPIIDFYLFMADRRDHIERRIRPAVQNDELVVSDRYADSTRVYQPVALVEGGSPYESQWNAKSFIEGNMAAWNYEPDLTLYIDVPVETALERAAEDEKYEQRQFLEQVKENYDALADANNRIVRIDGTMSEDDVASRAIELVEEVDNE